MSKVSVFITSMVIAIICDAEKIRYLSLERPNVDYWNPSYFNYLNISSRRHNRKDPVHYVAVFCDNKYSSDNNVSVEVVFYQYLSNQYKRSFVELHFMLCDVLTKDTFFGDAFKQGVLKSGCPIQPGIIRLYNMTIPTRNVPYNFPFPKGRIYFTMTSTNDAKDRLMSGHIDMEIKELKSNLTGT